MPKVAKELTALDVGRLKHPGDREAPIRIAVGGVPGLHLQITSSGAKSWLMRLSIGGKRRELGLGSYQEKGMKHGLGLAEARHRARDAKAQAREGIDPVAAKQEAQKAALAEQRRACTFTEAVEGYMSIATTTTEKNRKLMRNRFRTYVEDAGLGGHRVGSIDKHDIKKVLDPIWQTKTSTATRLREDIKKVFDWAIGNDHMVGPNPAEWDGNLEYMMPPPAKATTNRPAVAVADAPLFRAALAQRSGTGARALEFLLLTAARSGEVRGATWAEFDLDRGLWIIPAARMKMKREHRVPLPSAAVDLLRDLPRDNDRLFPAPRGGLLSDIALSDTMREMQPFIDPASGKPAVPHGLRSTFRSWAAERGYPRELAEAALAHQVGNAVEQAYQRSDVLERRRGMMEAWSSYLNPHNAMGYRENVYTL